MGVDSVFYGSHNEPYYIKAWGFYNDLLCDALIKPTLIQSTVAHEGA